MDNDSAPLLWIIIFIICPPIFFIWLGIAFIQACFVYPTFGYSVLAVVVGGPALLFLSFA